MIFLNDVFLIYKISIKIMDEFLILSLSSYQWNFFPLILIN
jgi:hypothetical protein